MTLPLAEYPILLHFPMFAPPRVLTGEEGTGIQFTGEFKIVNFGARVEDVARRLGATGIKIEVRGDRPGAFARMIAKIAYSFAFAEGALRRLEEPSPVLPSILGETEDIGRWVGTLDGPIRSYPGMIHRLAVHEDVRGLLIAEVQLFADSQTPTYGVVLGHLKR